MTEHHPDDVPGTTDFSPITKKVGDELMKEVVDWMSEFVVKFEKFEVPPINVSREAVLKKLKQK